MTCAKLPPLFKTLTNCCACHDIWKSVTFARPCHCDLWKQHLRHVTNAAPATTSRKATSQSAAPATKKRRACIESLPKYCACHAKHENDLPFCDLGPPKRAFRARLPPLFILWKTGWCRSACVPPNREKLTSWRRRRDDDTTTRQQNKANTGPTPDPNYKREPFATHSGKTSIHLVWTACSRNALPRNHFPWTDVQITNAVWTWGAHSCDCLIARQGNYLVCSSFHVCKALLQKESFGCKSYVTLSNTDARRQATRKMILTAHNSTSGHRWQLFEPTCTCFWNWSQLVCILRT